MLPFATVQDTRDFWGAGNPLYDRGLITVPTFLAHAECFSLITHDAKLSAIAGQTQDLARIAGRKRPKMRANARVL